jgi:hypothetical protein
VADFRDFLAAREPVVLPYFGGSRVDAADRRLRVDASAELAIGWHRFRIDGRRAAAIDRASAPPLDALPRVRGHWIDGWLVIDGRNLARVALPPDDEPPPLARATARRWYSHDLVFDALDFEDDAELAARAALEAAQPLGDVRGVVPSLRAAFAIGFGAAVARERGVAVSPPELAPHAVAIAERNRPAVVAWLDELAAERRRADADARRRAAQDKLAGAADSAQLIERAGDPRQRADDALDSAKARMIACRRLEQGMQLDVTYEVDGTKIMSLVSAVSLRVIDPGVCLGHDGEYRELTLDAMPSVVREAIRTGRLNVTRRA